MRLDDILKKYPRSEISNGIVVRAPILREDHGFLTSVIDVRTAHFSIGFGGYNLNKTLSVWADNVLKTFENSDWERLKGLSCRIACVGDCIAIGNFIEDVWFCPSMMKEFNGSL